MSKPRGRRRGGGISHPLFVIFLLLFLSLSAASFAIMDWRRATLIGFDGAAAAFLALSVLQMGRARADDIRRLSARNDAGRTLLLAIVAILSFVILVVVGLEVEAAGRASGVEVALAATTLTLAWFFANLIYAVHYAHLFYDPGPAGGDHAGLQFPGTDQPTFGDFCYFAFVLGMTFQVSDVAIVSQKLRRTATIHGLLAFFFNIGVLAVTVNVVASTLALH